MGCSSSKPDQGFDLQGEYAKKNLPVPEQGTYENEFEKEAYQVVNLIRADTKA